MSMQLLIIILHMRYDFNRHWKENLLCPFHYFGITDLQLEGDAIDENTGLKDFIKLTSDERVSYVIEQIEYYGYAIVAGEQKGWFSAARRKKLVF